VNVPIALVRSAVARLPTARLIESPNEAQLSTLCNRIAVIAEALLPA
jgi:hypothetical protein